MAPPPSDAAVAGAGLVTAPVVSAGYRTYALGLLLVIYVCNFVDRNMLSVVAQPMKQELGLADWQIGMLGGLAFALFYVIVGIPVARLAERRNRTRIISVLLVAWSAMTALCGVAQNYAQLFLARVGVGVGEAGCSPASHSLIGDYFPAEKRSTALSIYSIGIPAGPMIAGIVGGWAALHFGWRAAFFVVAVPGLVLAVLARLTLKEPVRGVYDPIHAAGTPAPDFMAVVRLLASKRTFLHIAAGSALATFANYGISTFAVPYLLRGFSLNIAQAGSGYGLISGLSACAGTVLAGFLVDKLGARDRRYYVLIPAIGTLVSTPLYLLVLMQTDIGIMAPLVVVPAVVHYLYLGPTFGMTANMVDARMRATASAIVLLILNFIGLGFGPLVVGFLSDVFAGQVFTGEHFLTACPGGRAPTGADAATADACKAASFAGLKYALMVAAGFYAWASLHYLAATKWIKKDLLPQA